MTDRELLLQLLPDATLDLGTLAAALVAAAIAWFGGLRDHFKRQERDEVSRRFVDEGLDALGRHLAEAYAREQTNLDAVEIAIAVTAKGDEASLMETLKSLRSDHAGAPFAAYRISMMFPMETFSSAVIQAYGDLRNAHAFSCQQSVAYLRNIVGVIDRAERDRQLLRASEALARHRGRIGVLRHLICVSVAQVSAGFQSAKIETISLATSPKSIHQVRQALEEVNANLQNALATLEKAPVPNDLPGQPRQNDPS